ncbi:hypothetical protein HKX48_009040, partial [Thoreauomyces humboldtii]
MEAYQARRANLRSRRRALMQAAAVAAASDASDDPALTTTTDEIQQQAKEALALDDRAEEEHVRQGMGEMDPGMAAFLEMERKLAG